MTKFVAITRSRIANMPIAICQNLHKNGSEVGRIINVQYSTTYLFKSATLVYNVSLQ